MSTMSHFDSEKHSLEASRSNSWTESASERPDLYRRNSLASLSVARDPSQPLEEQKWPRGWKPYACLLSGFLLMFNSWGLVCCHDIDHDLWDRPNKPQVNAYGTYASYYRQHLLPGRDIMLLNLVGSTQSFVVLILSAVVGRFLDAGHIRELLIAGTILVSLGSFLLSIVNRQGRYDEGNYNLIWLTQGLISGLGMACFFVSSSQGECQQDESVYCQILTRHHSRRHMVQSEERTRDRYSRCRYDHLALNHSI